LARTGPWSSPCLTSSYSCWKVLRILVRMEESTSSAFISATYSIIARSFRGVATRTLWPGTCSSRLMSKPIRIDWSCKILLSSKLLRLPTTCSVLLVFIFVLWMMHIAIGSLFASCWAQKVITNRPLLFLAEHLLLSSLRLSTPCLILGRTTASSWVSTNGAPLLLVLYETTTILWHIWSHPSSVRMHV
jgi:hypothetical protein